jgi:hypothetical protein
MAKKNDMTVTTSDLYNILRSKIGETEAKTLVEYVEQKITLQVEGELTGLASKADLMSTKGDIKSEISNLEIKIEKTKPKSSSGCLFSGQGRPELWLEFLRYSINELHTNH